MKLQDKFNIEEVNIESDSIYGYAKVRDFGGNLVDKKVTKIKGGRYITFKFKNNFRIGIDGQLVILRAYEQDLSTNQVALEIGSYIKKHWLNQIINLNQSDI